MKLPPIQSLWIGSDLSNLEKLCVQSFLDHGHQFHLYTYGNVGGIPSGATVMDANEILPEADVYSDRTNSYANFSDWFRYELLAARGGWWVDMDCVCVKPFDFADEFVFIQDRSNINNSTMRCPPGSELCAALAASCRDFSKPQPWDTPKDRATRAKVSERAQLPYIFLGPLMLDKAIPHFGLAQFVKPYMTFIPIDIWQQHYIFNDAYAGGIDFPQATRCVHMWNNRLEEMVGHKVLPKADIKNARFSEKSLYEQLKAKHGVATAAEAPFISPEQIRHAMFATGHLADARSKIARLKISRRNWGLGLTVLGFVAGAVVGWGVG